MAKAANLFRCVIMGPPGSGKGTISGRIVGHFGMKHVSSGDYIRDHIKNDTVLGKEAKVFLEKGELVPDGITSKMISSVLDGMLHKNWLLDGFPRTVHQAKFLQERHPADCVMSIDVPFEEIVERLKLRWIHEPSGRVYNLDWNPPKNKGQDDVTGEPLTQREDDKPDVVMKRLQTYAHWGEPVAKHYEDLKLLARFPGRATNEIWPKVFEYLADKMKPLKAMENK